jgi:hypothetical protein
LEDGYVKPSLKLAVSIKVDIEDKTDAAADCLLLKFGGR